MFEILALNLPDSDFYNMVDIRHEIVVEMEKHDDPDIAYIAGPKFYSLQKNDSYPMVVSTKKRDDGRRNYSIATQGTLVFSSVETGEIVLQKLIQDEKMPPLEEDEEPAYPPGYAPLVTTTYDSFWKSIPVHDLLNVGKWRVNLHIGEYISNGYEFEFKSSESVKPSDFLLKLSTAIKDHEQEDLSGFEKFEHSPDLPSEGINFACPGSSSTESGSPLIIYGSFRFKYLDNGDFRYFPVNVLITSPENEVPHLVQILVPLHLLSANGDVKQGFFQFDLMKVFYSSHLERYSVPSEVCISGVYKDYFSKPKRIRLTEK